MRTRGARERPLRFGMRLGTRQVSEPAGSRASARRPAAPKRDTSLPCGTVAVAARGERSHHLAPAALALRARRAMPQWTTPLARSPQPRGTYCKPNATGKPTRRAYDIETYATAGRRAAATVEPPLNIRPGRHSLTLPLPAPTFRAVPPD